MEELKQIATVLGSLGVEIENIAFMTDLNGSQKGSDLKRINLILNHRGKKILRSYTIDEIRSSLIIDARTQPSEPLRADRRAKGVLRRILQK